jgi:DNA polymerase sigma
MDSDLEDKIMSMVQYGSGLTKKKALATPIAPEVPVVISAPAVSKIAPINKPKVVYAPLDTKDKQKTKFSASNELQLQNSDDSSSEDEDEEAGLLHSSDEEEEENNENSDNEEYSSAQEDLGVPEEEEAKQDTVLAEPQITRYINLGDDDKQYMEDEDTSEEEAELGLKLQELIEEQVKKIICKLERKKANPFGY